MGGCPKADRKIRCCSSSPSGHDRPDFDSCNRIQVMEISTSLPWPVALICGRASRRIGQRRDATRAPSWRPRLAGVVETLSLSVSSPAFFSRPTGEPSGLVLEIGFAFHPSLGSNALNPEGVRGSRAPPVVWCAESAPHCFCLATAKPLFDYPQVLVHRTTGSFSIGLTTI